MNTLYPLKFKPILKDVLWGGQKLKNILHKNATSEKCGESWEICDLEDNSSIVSNGFLAGNTLNELLEIYMGDLVGDFVYEQFSDQFPLLIKFIDAREMLSIQVHPNDEMAAEEHECFGKTEMWYVMNAEPGSELIVGFNKEINEETYLEHFNNNNLTNILNHEKVQVGDVFYLPAGRVHAIGGGIMVAEVQQTSNITYRIFDWNRTDTSGNKRELHTEKALKAIDFSFKNDYKPQYTEKKNEAVNLVNCPYFSTNLISFDKTLERDYFNFDSFIIYICLEGAFSILSEDCEPVSLQKGETVLVPAVIKNLRLQPETPSKIMEVYIPEHGN